MCRIFCNCYDFCSLRLNTNKYFLFCRSFLNHFTWFISHEKKCLKIPKMLRLLYFHQFANLVHKCKFRNFLEKKAGYFFDKNSDRKEFTRPSYYFREKPTKINFFCHSKANIPQNSDRKSSWSCLMCWRVYEFAVLTRIS